MVFNEVYGNYMVVSWNPPLDDGGCAISNYIIEKRDTNRDLWMPVTSSCTRTSCRVRRVQLLNLSPNPVQFTFPQRSEVKGVLTMFKVLSFFILL